MTLRLTETYKREHLFNIIVFEYEHKTNNCEMCIIKLSFSPSPGWFHGSKVCSEAPQVHDNRMGHRKPFIPLNVWATCNILTRTPIHFISHLASIVVPHSLCLQEYDEERISTKDCEYGSTWWPI
jgi:hypothetical protein